MLRISASDLASGGIHLGYVYQRYRIAPEAFVRARIHKVNLKVDYKYIQIHIQIPDTFFSFKAFKAITRV